MKNAKIFIASDRLKNPIAVVLSDNKEKAKIAFTAMRTEHDSIEEIDINTVSAPNDLAFIFGFKTVSVGSGMGRREMKILKRGL